MLNKMGKPRPLFLFFSSTNFTEKTVGFSGIRTPIAGKEGEQADHFDHHHGPITDYVT